MDRLSRTASLASMLLSIACASGPEVRPGYDAEAEYEEEILAEIEWLILEGMKQARSPREGLPLLQRGANAGTAGGGEAASRDRGGVPPAAGAVP
jgi:hypothetical protein